MSARLSIRDLSVRFPRRDGTVTGLHDVSMEVRPGEILAMVGSSGAGKSLLAHAVLGLLPSHAERTGEIRFEGRPLNAEALKSLRGRRIALVPQSVTHLDPFLMLGRQLALAARRAGVADPGQGAWEHAGLDPAVSKLRAHELSGGMARRALFALALVGEPDLVLADEPTDHLDAMSAAIVLGRLKDVAARGGTVVLVTHDLASVLPHADRVAVMRDGRLSGMEEPGSFTGGGEALSTPYARRLWRALPQNGFGAADA